MVCYRKVRTYNNILHIHITVMLNEQFTSLLLSPMGGGMKGRPAIHILSIYICPCLQ